MPAENNLRVCPLCRGAAEAFHEKHGIIYFSCAGCGGIFVPPEFHLSAGDEKKRYLEHNYDVNDPAYRKFAAPAVNFVLRHFSPWKQEGLGLGSGTGPVITAMLEEKGFAVSLYDLFFHPERKNLRKKCDFIIASEVIERFKKPAIEFRLLADILRKPGALVCMTEVCSSGCDFASWYYKNDPTHVFFYSEKTMELIRKAYGFH